MAASNHLFKNTSVDESIVSSASGICNQGISMNDSSNSSFYANSAQPVSSSNSSDRQSNELIDLNEANNLEVSLNLKNSQLNRMNSPLAGQSSNHPTSLGPAAEQHNQQAIDIALQNYLLDYKSFADDTKSMTSVMTSKSTRETFECLSRVLPVGILLLIVFIMIHFVLYVHDIEPFQSITEVICIALAICVFTLSSAFIMKIFCDSKDRSYWTNNPYGEEYVYSPNSHYYYTGSAEQPVIASSNLPSHLINSSLNASKPPPTNFLNPASGGDSFAQSQDTVIRKQPHSYVIDTCGNRIYAAQMAGLEFKRDEYKKRYANELPGYYQASQSAASSNFAAGNRLEPASQFAQNQFTQIPFNPTQSVSQFAANQLGQTQFGQMSPQFARRTSTADASFDQRNPAKLSGIDKKMEQAIQTINLMEARRKEAISMVKETAT